jgi:hypothetical protein
MIAQNYLQHILEVRYCYGISQPYDLDRYCSDYVGLAGFKVCIYISSSAASQQLSAVFHRSIAVTCYHSCYVRKHMIRTSARSPCFLPYACLVSKYTARESIEALRRVKSYRSARLNTIGLCPPSLAIL